MVRTFVLLSMLLATAPAAAQQNLADIDFSTSPAHPVDSFHVVEAAFGCPSPAAATEMLGLARMTSRADVLLRAESRSPITGADEAEAHRAAYLNCIPLAPAKAFALRREVGGTPIFRSWTDADGNAHVAVAGVIDLPGAKGWKFYVPVGIVENAQSFTSLAAPNTAPTWQPDDRYLPVQPHYSMPKGVMP